MELYPPKYSHRSVKTLTGNTAESGYLIGMFTICLKQMKSKKV